MKKLFLYTVSFLSIGLAGCDKYLDVNTDPNLVTNPPINSLLVSSTYQTGLNVQRMGNVTSYYVQYLASPNAGSDRDTYKEEDLSVTWNNHYNAMTDIRQMMRLAQERVATEHLGVAKVLMAMNLNMLINTFGDVPYTEAFQGKEDLTPAFDDEQALHDTTLKLVNEAIAEFNKPAPIVRLDAASDQIHKGSVAAWKKTAYALKARFLNQLSKTNKYNATEILAAVANAYTSNADNAALTAFQGNSPWNQVARNNANLLLDGWLSEQFVDALNGTSFGTEDPRLPLITNKTRNGVFRGTPNGAGRIGSGTNNEESVLQNTATSFYSKTGAALWLVTFAEVKFIEAEAAFRSNDRTRAYAAYLAGIRAHMDMMGVDAAARDAYISSPTVSVGATALTLAHIFKEKYVAMFLHPEAWVDARRFNYQYKDFSLPVGAALGEFIRRAAYPLVEASRNGANVPEVTMTTRLWWDQ
jgi:accessory colonization factor AcfC